MAERHNPGDRRGLALVLAGVVVAFLAWLVPARLKSVSPSLLAEAGAGTTSVAAFGRDLADLEETGPAALVLRAATEAGDPRAPALGRAVAAGVARNPVIAAWGGWDATLAPIFGIRPGTGGGAALEYGAAGGAASGGAAPGSGQPVLNFLIPYGARAAVLAQLSGSGSDGVQSLLRTRRITSVGRFIPATQPGGAPLDAAILMTALLYQEQRMDPALMRELRGLSEAANDRNDLGDLEGFYLDFLSLSRRLDWTQLGELMRHTGDTATVGEFAHLARVAPDQLPELYASALMSGSSDGVASYLIRYGKLGAGDLRLALTHGQGAVTLLVARQLPVDRSWNPVLPSAAGLVLEAPRTMLAVKYLGYLLGFFLMLMGLDAWVVIPAGGAGRNGLQHVRGGLLALALSALVIVSTEPYLLHAVPLSEYRITLHLPVLASLAASPSPQSSPHPIAMETSTLISIAVFATLQVAMYLLCLRKMAEIDRQDIPPALKLRLLENEENLFDSGLYVGMMGTAAALVLQVMGVIDPNLLAAYSSNLFGIVCVALVKIRHVRGVKRRLILAVQAATPA